MKIINHSNENKSGLEIISIHIPKTAGRSFKEVLVQVYGPSLDKRYKKEHFFKKGKEQKSLGKRLSTDIRGLHGHLTIKQVEKLIKKHNPKVITWLRDPVDRVISNYYFLLKRISLGIVKEHIKRKKDISLLEYAEARGNKNRMSRTLQGLDIRDFFFIGIMERFDADIQVLAEKMNWPEISSVPYVNDNSDFKRNHVCTTMYNDIDEEMRSRIASLNRDDIQLYKEVLHMRGIELDHGYE